MPQERGTACCTRSVMLTLVVIAYGDLFWVTIADTAVVGLAAYLLRPANSLNLRTGHWELA